jgi:hypothetical protein
MSGLVPNSITLYLRPTDAIQPYNVRQCAIWLVKKKVFTDVNKAISWLLFAEENDAFQYKAVMSKYFEETDYRVEFHRGRDVNKYRSSSSNYYGDEPHMW